MPTEPESDIFVENSALRKKVYAAIVGILGGRGEVIYVPDSGEWAIRWLSRPLDPETKLPPIVYYQNAGEAFNAAVAANRT